MRGIFNAAVKRVFTHSMIRFFKVRLSNSWFSDYHTSQKYYSGDSEVSARGDATMQRPQLHTPLAVFVSK